MRSFYVISFITLLMACNEEEPTSRNSLQSFIENRSGIVSDSSVIACAGGAADSINIYYYPEPGFGSHRLWQLTSFEADPSDFENYEEVSAESSELFNGYLAFFHLTILEAETWFIVTGDSGEELTIAQPISSKQLSAPTEINPDVLSIDQSSILEPSFSWEDGTNDGTVIYFHVISDSDNNLLSGTYTFERSWQFYDLSNVVLNIRDISPPPALDANESYGFTLMGVSQDNWVNMLVSTNFRTSN